AIIKYTAFGLPRKITPRSGGASTKLAYDADHLRVRKKRGVVKTTYVGGLYEKRKQGNRTEHVFYVTGRDRIVAQLSRVVDRVGRTERVVYFHSDHLGTVETLTDAAGAVIGHRKHDPFGNQVNLQEPVLRATPRPSPLASVRLGFTEHEEDFDLGLINMVGRVYDPKVGRFLTPDPITADPSGQGLNSYSYVRNNPLTFVDPVGLQAAAPDAPTRDPDPAPGQTTVVTMIYTPPGAMDYRPGAFDDAGFTPSQLTSRTPPPLPGVSAPPSSLIQGELPDLGAVFINSVVTGLVSPVLGILSLTGPDAPNIDINQVRPFPYSPDHQSLGEAMELVMGIATGSLASAAPKLIGVPA
ncbi:MAG: RHS repeat domain-containing protein, partial [bacterium]